MNKYQKLNKKWWSIDRHKSLTIIIDKTYEIIKKKIVYFINRARHFATPVGARCRKDVWDTIHTSSGQSWSPKTLSDWNWDEHSLPEPCGPHSCQRVMLILRWLRSLFNKSFVAFAGDSSQICYILDLIETCWRNQLNINQPVSQETFWPWCCRLYDVYLKTEFSREWKNEAT